MHNNTSYCLLLSSSVCSGVRVGNVQTSLEQVLSQTVNRVAWLTFADVQKPVGQDWHKVVEQVLSDRLWFVVEHFLLLIAKLWHSCLGSGFFLLFQNQFNHFLPKTQSPLTFHKVTYYLFFSLNASAISYWLIRKCMLRLFSATSSKVIKLKGFSF